MKIRPASRFSIDRPQKHHDAESPKSTLFFVWHGTISDRLGLLGAVILLVCILMALLAPVVAPYDPNEAFPLLRLNGPGTPGHLLGLDTQGRDVLTRIVYGTQMSLITGIAPVLIGGLIAIPLGMIAAYYARTGQLIMRIMDIFFAFPMVLLAILLTTFIGPGLTNLILSLTLVLIPYNTRIVYIESKAQMNRDYVEAARAVGSGDATILFVEMLPHIVSASIVYSMTVMGPIIVIAAGLSFLGLGIQPPTPEWGLMVGEGRLVIHKAPYLSTLPGIMIVVLVTGINLFGDSLRDSLDPRTRLLKVKAKQAEPKEDSDYHLS